MDTKTSEWRPGPTVCRCCLTEGCYKDISTEYFWMGKREVYAEMLSDTFNVSISFSQSGGPNSNSRLICEPCISRLRDASDFKRQVQECEKTFMHHLDPGTSSIVDDLVEPQETDVKLERVKLEKRLSDDEFIEHTDFIEDDDDDDDDLDDQPLTKLATRIPKKESVDLLDLLDNAKTAEKRKSSTKVKATSSKKAKLAKIVKKESVKATASKVAQKTEKKKKELNPMSIAKRNAQTIIQFTTIYPFRLPESSIVCVFCCESFEDAAEFRRHMDAEHTIVNVKVAFAHLHTGYIKGDCTDIRCRICSVRLPKLEDAARHLNDVHNKYINFKHYLGVQPFIMEIDRLSCAVCNLKCSNIRTLSRHLHEHSFSCTCELCGKSFASQGSLLKHVEFSCPLVPKQRKCRKCKLPLYSREDQIKHFETSKKCCQHLCPVCGDRFSNWKIKRQHMEESHKIPKKVYPCPECGVVFVKPNKFRAHFKIVHTEEHFACPSCDKKFDTKYFLARHMVVHSKERLFSCDVCAKSFPRKSTLIQHMWIHSEVKKYVCKVCVKPFNQKVSWKTHMKSYHPELCDF